MLSGLGSLFWKENDDVLFTEPLLLMKAGELWWIVGCFSQLKRLKSKRCCVVCWVFGVLGPKKEENWLLKGEGAGEGFKVFTALSVLTFNGGSQFIFLDIFFVSPARP